MSDEQSFIQDSNDQGYLLLYSTDKNRILKCEASSVKTVMCLESVMYSMI